MEKVIKRSEVRERLNINKYQYKQLVDSGILPAPIRLSENSHPFHTESQIKTAEEKLRIRSNPQPARSSRSGLSNKQYQELQKAFQS